MKPLLLLAGLALMLVGCADSTPHTAVAAPQPARYATPEERMKLAEEARKNFERERAAHQNGTPRPAVEARLATVGEPAAEEGTRFERTRYPLSEARYAMQIGKRPSELTAAERVLAHSE